MRAFFVYLKERSLFPFTTVHYSTIFVYLLDFFDRRFSVFSVKFYQIQFSVVKNNIYYIQNT